MPLRKLLVWSFNHSSFLFCFIKWCIVDTQGFMLKGIQSWNQQRGRSHSKACVSQFWEYFPQINLNVIDSQSGKYPAFRYVIVEQELNFEPVSTSYSHFSKLSYCFHSTIIARLFCLILRLGFGDDLTM